MIEKELEDVLGINIETERDKQNKNLVDYAMFKYIPLDEVVAIFLGLEGKDKNILQNHKRYNVIYSAIKIAVENEEIQAIFDYNFALDTCDNIKLSHTTAKKWAIAHNLNWNVPPYIPINSVEENHIEQNTNTELTQALAKITELEQEIAELKQQSALAKNAVEKPINTQENYNPTEKTTHLLMIYGLTQTITKPNFQIGKYLKANGVNQRAIYTDILNETNAIFSDPETKQRGLEGYKKKLSDILKLDELKAD